MSTRLFCAAFALLAFALPACADGPTGTWRTTAELVPLRHFTCTLLESGEVLVVGGETQLGSSTHECRAYDPLTDTWRRTAPMPGSRSDHAAILLPSGKVLVTGGRSSQRHPADETLIYDPTLDAWDRAGPNAWRYDRFGTKPRLVLLDTGRVFAVNEYVARDARVFDPSTRTWRSEGDDLLAWRRTAPAGGGVNIAALPNGRVFMTATADTGAWPTPGDSLVLDTRAGTMTRAGHLHTNDKIVALENGHVIGALRGRTEIWRGSGYSRGLPGSVFSSAGLAVLPSGRVVSFPHADHRHSDGEQFRVQIFDLAASSPTWHLVAPSTGIVRSGHQHVVLASGEIMLLGGADGSQRPLPTRILRISDEVPPASSSATPGNSQPAATPGIVSALGGNATPPPATQANPEVAEARIEDGQLHVIGQGFAGSDVRVYLGGRRMSVSKRTGATLLVADLPKGTVGSAVRVRVDGRMSDTVRLTVPAQAPDMGRARRYGTLLVIDGRNLGSATNDVSVFLRGRSLRVLWTSRTRVVVSLHGGPRSGTLQMEVDGLRSTRKRLR